MLYLLSYQATWIDGQLWVRDDFEHMIWTYDDLEHMWIWIYENHVCKLRINMSEIMILIVIISPMFMIIHMGSSPVQA